MSTGLIGLNKCELFTVLTGVGRNGKSKLIQLIKYAFGDYFGDAKCKLLTGSRPDENSPEPGLLALKNKRIVICSEPEKKDKLNTGFIKFITGNDYTNLRECHKNDMVSFKANFITLLVCNKIPDCDEIDNAFAKRLRCINFPTEFVKNPTKENQKLINENLQDNLEKWKSDFMYLIIQYYYKYKEHGLNPTRDILKWTNMYKEKSDLFLTFLNECTFQVSKGGVHCTELYDVFKNWYRKNSPGEKVPNKSDFITNVTTHKEYEKSISINGKVSTGFKKINIHEDFSLKSIPT